MIEFDFFVLKLKLYTWDSVLAENFAVKIQYYSFEDADWLTVLGGTVKSGILLLNEDVKAANSTQNTFYNLIKAGNLPPMRIAPGAVPNPNLIKTPLIASSFTFNHLATGGLGTYQVDFGTLYLIPDELILDSNSAFEDILPVANYFPISGAIVEPPVPPIPIQDLYTNIVSEIVAASDTGIDSPYKLSNISLKLKALIHEDGGSMSATLLDLENSENVNEAAISELLFDITPVDHRQNTTAIMPNCIGLTETAVRRILKNAGLRLNPVYQKNESVVNGDSFKQSPIQGTGVQPNQLVTVIFSKHE